MKNRFQLGFLLGSLIPLAAICVLGHSERVCFAAGAGFLLVPALLWPRKLAGWLSGLGGFYERVTLRPAKVERRQNPVSGPQVCSPRGDSGSAPRADAQSATGRSTTGNNSKSETANAQPKAESPRRRQDIVELTLVRNYHCPKPRAREIAAAVAQIPDEDARIMAAMRMVRA